jgi:hypothetical protein
VQRVALIPDRYSDHRMWADLPDRLAYRAEVIHLDEHIQLPWAAGEAAIVAAARVALSSDGCDVAAAAGQACPFAVALGRAGLARSLVLFAPEIPFDRIPDDVDLTLDLPDNDFLAPYQPLIDALTKADPGDWRALLTDVIRQTAPTTTAPGELDLAIAIARDHAEEMRAELQAFAADSAVDRDLPDDVQRAQLRARGQWLDYLAALRVPILVVAPGRSRFLAQTITRLASYASALLTDGADTFAPGGSRAAAVAAVESMLDRVSGQEQASPGSPPDPGRPPDPGSPADPAARPA